MSWSITLVGTTSNVVKALKDQAKNMEAQSRIEFEDAMPHLIALVEQNFTRDRTTAVKLTASGYGYAVNGEQHQRYCAVSLEQFYGQVV